MTNTERNFVKLAIDFIRKANDENLYSSDRQTAVDTANAILNTLLEEEEDGRGQMD